MSIGGETVVSVGRARNRRRLYIRPGKSQEPEKQKIGRNRNRSRRTRKLKCDKNKLDSFLQNVEYPLREDSPINVECAKEACLDKVRLEAQDKTQPLWLCKNHYEWVNERESKLGELNVRVRLGAQGEAQ
jgi:hypothetical protein